MANSKLKNSMGPIIEMESVTMFAAAETIATGGATIPTKCTRIAIKATAALHWHPTGTPTSSFGHAVAASEIFYLEHGQFGAKIIDDASTDRATLVAYMI